jgi:hypothetical protein
MAETLNKRIRAALAAEARENTRRYWAQKAAAIPAENSAPLAAAEQRASASPATAEQNPHPPILTREEPK